MLGASVWIGGQLMLAALVPVLRGISDAAPGWPPFFLGVMLVV